MVQWKKNVNGQTSVSNIKWWCRAGGETGLDEAAHEWDFLGKLVCGGNEEKTCWWCGDSKHMMQRNTATCYIHCYIMEYNND